MSERDWLALPHAVDMACYAFFYQDIIHHRLEVNRARNTQTLVVEAGVRYGCSARIFMDTLKNYQNWRLHLIDPFPKNEALVLTKKDQHVKFHQAKAEVAAKKFENCSIDILHIDGDCDGTHPYELTFLVLLAFWSKLKADAQVIFHDATEAFPGVLRVIQDMALSGLWKVDYATPQAACPISAPAVASRVNMVVEHDGMDSGMSVVIPVIKDKWLGQLLEKIQMNITKPTEIIVIDNSETDVCKPICERFSDALNIRYLPQKKNLGVNASWNLGIKLAQNEFVSVLNDDIIIHDEFFEMILQTFEAFPSCGLVVPNTILNPKLVQPPTDAPKVSFLPMREGWAFTIRRSLVVDSPIPEEFFTFCGDDWLYHKVIEKGFWPFKITNNNIFHHVGISQNLDERARLKLPPFIQERTAWLAMQGKDAQGRPLKKAARSN